MLKLIYLALNVKPEEQHRALLLLGLGFFMGVFFATFQITSETQLITQAAGGENSVELIGQGLLAAAILGVLATAFFAFFQTRVRFGGFVIFCLTMILLVVVMFYFLFNVLPAEYVGILAFIQFACMGPMVAIFLLVFWGVFGRLFGLRESKRIIGGIDTGQLVAAILTFFSIGLGAAIAQTYSLLIVSAIGVLGALVFLIAIVKKYKLGKVQVGFEKTRNVSIKEMASSQYVILLALFISFSITAYLLVENSYLSALSDQYPIEEEASLRQFLGWFNGSILILSFIFQTFFNDRIIAEYGLKVSLMILPVILAVLTLTTLAIGFTIGYTVDSGSFFIFFIFVALTKLFITFLRDALENPAFKLYFMTLENDIRFDIQAKIEGVVVEFSKVIAGGIILLLIIFNLASIMYFYGILVFVIVGWLLHATKLYAEYRNKIRDKLENQDIAIEEVDIAQEAVISNIKHSLTNAHSATAVFSFKLLEKINPIYVAPAINMLMRHKNEDVRVFAQNRMNSFRGVSVSDRYIIATADNKFLEGRVMVNSDEIANLMRTGSISRKRIARLCRSDEAQDRQYGAELIGNLESEDSLSFLIELLHDIDHNVRIAAISSAQKRYNHEIINGLVSNLHSMAYSNLAKSALYVIGEEALPVLDNAFYKAGQDALVMYRIVQIMGRIGGRLATDMLWNKIDYPDKIISSQVLDSLSESGFKADLSRVTRIKFAIEGNISDIAWNIAAYNEVPENKFMRLLKRALQEENDHDIKHIYTLLSMLYDTKSIYLIKQNLESGTSEGVTYAIELLDVLLSEDLKQKIIPILDDISEVERSKKLQIYYPRAKLSTQLVLKFLVNREFTQSNRWTKACSLYQIGRLKIKEFKYDFIANLFNPDMLVKEMAAWGLYNIDTNLYHEHIVRLPKEDQVVISKNVVDRKAEMGDGNLIFEKVQFLQSIDVFDDVTGLLLSYLADNMPTRLLSEGETLSLEGEMARYFVIVRSGKANLYNGGELLRTLVATKFIGEQTEYQRNHENMLVALEDTHLLFINKDRYYELLSDNLLFAQSVIRHMTA